MLFLLFQLGKDRYALDSSRVVEVVPLVALRQMPLAAPGFAGIFNYRGHPVPAIDLCQLTLGQPASEFLSTRIIVISCADADGNERLLGLIAERATEMMRREANEFKDHGFEARGAPHLGPVLFDDQGAIQWIHEQKLLSENVRKIVFTEASQLAV